MNKLSCSSGKVCRPDCDYTLPEKLAEFAQGHPEHEAYVFRENAGNVC